MQLSTLFVQKVSAEKGNAHSDIQKHENMELSVSFSKGIPVLTAIEFQFRIKLETS